MVPASLRDADVDTVDGLLRAAAVRWPDRPAVEGPSGRWTYAAFDAAVSAAAAALVSAGAAPGDRVAFALSHDVALYAAPFVCARAGVTGLLLGTAAPPAAWARQLARAGPRLLVADDAHAERLHAAAGGTPVTASRTALDFREAASGAEVPTITPDPDRAVALIATSGTTGDPAIVRLTSRGLLHVGTAYLDVLDLGPDERSFVVMPMTHIGALSTQTMTMPLVGGCNVLPATTRPRGALGRMAQARITLLDAAPAWLTVLTRDAPTPVPTWRTLVHGGAPMPTDTADRLATAYPGLAMVDVWGLSEAHGPVTALCDDRRRQAPAGTVGRPLPGLRVQAVGAAGRLPADTVGELWVSGPTVHAGTLDAPGGSLRDGWLPTGDLGAVAADGTVRLTGRMKDLILRGGFTISSREVEQVLCSAEGVTDAAAFAVSDELGGEAVGAVVVLGPDSPTGVSGLRRLVAERLGTPAVPRRITCLDELPRTPTGKVDKPALRDLV